jgi:chromosome partitioning protein
MARNCYTQGNFNPMSHVIAVCTHKGGTGKTVTAVSLAAGFASAGRRVLLVDLDPQAHSTIGVGVIAAEPTLRDFYERHPSVLLRDVIRHAPSRDRLDVAPSDLRLAWTAEGLAGRPKKEDLLRRGLKQVSADYDVVVIDTPPSLGVMTQNAVTAADFILIPAVFEARAADAIADLLELARLLKGDAFDAFRIVLTRFDARRTKTNTAVLAALRPWEGHLLRSVIPQSEPLNQAQMAGQDVFRFDESSAGAKAYRDLINEIQPP